MTRTLAAPLMLLSLEEVDAAAVPSDTVRVSSPSGYTETDRANIQAALDAVQVGGTVLFAPGTYLLGAGARLTVPDPPGGDGPARLQPGSVRSLRTPNGARVRVHRPLRSG